MGMARDDRPLTPKDTIAELLANYPAAARVLIGYRMHCVGCDIAPFETIAEACIIYGVSVDDVFAEIRHAIAAQEDHR
jgi:hybrid cluster-associated redox disulfide protein